MSRKFYLGLVLLCFAFASPAFSADVFGYLKIGPEETVSRIADNISKGDGMQKRAAVTELEGLVDANIPLLATDPSAEEILNFTGDYVLPLVWNGSSTTAMRSERVMDDTITKLLAQTDTKNKAQLDPVKRILTKYSSILMNNAENPTSQKFAKRIEGVFVKKRWDLPAKASKLNEAAQKSTDESKAEPAPKAPDAKPVAKKEEPAKPAEESYDPPAAVVAKTPPLTAPAQGPVKAQEVKSVAMPTTGTELKVYKPKDPPPPVAVSKPKEDVKPTRVKFGSPTPSTAPVVPTMVVPAPPGAAPAPVVAPAPAKPAQVVTLTDMERDGDLATFKLLKEKLKAADDKGRMNALMLADTVKDKLANSARGTVSDLHDWAVDVINSIRRLVKAENPEVRAKAIKLVGDLKDWESAEFLVDNLLDANQGVKTSALVALQSITGQNFAYDKDAWKEWLKNQK